MFFKKSFRKIDFLVLGAQKAGTSALNSQLGRHPSVGLGRTKELHFFDNEDLFKKGSPSSYSAFHKQFDFDSGASIFGETTPIYLYWPAAPARIWKYNKDIKLIALLRNPTERAFSHWSMEKARGKDTLSFSEAIRKERERCKGALPDPHRVFSYVDRGFYAEQVRRYQRFFSEDQLCFLPYEDLRKAPDKTMRSIFSFLGVDPDAYRFEPQIVNKTTYQETLKPSDREFLIEVFRNDIKELERLLGWDCSNWLI